MAENDILNHLTVPDIPAAYREMITSRRFKFSGLFLICIKIDQSGIDFLFL